VLDGDSRGVYGGIQAADGAVVATWESSATPVEVVRVDARSRGHVTLSRFNAERAAGLDRPAFREFWFTSGKGRRIHNWLALQPGFDEAKEYPLVLFIHGGPFSSSLVYPAGNTVTFRAYLRLQHRRESQCLGSEWQALDKDCNAVMQPQGRSRRASRKALIRCVIALGRGMAMTCEPCLAAKRFPAR